MDEAGIVKPPLVYHHCQSYRKKWLSTANGRTGRIVCNVTQDRAAEVAICLLGRARTSEAGRMIYGRPVIRRRGDPVTSPESDEQA